MSEDWRIKGSVSGWLREAVAGLLDIGEAPTGFWKDREGGGWPLEGRGRGGRLLGGQGRGGRLMGGQGRGGRLLGGQGTPQTA